MRLLMIYANKFGYKTTLKTVESVPEIDEEKKIEDVLVGFIHAEEDDEKNLKYIETKLIKHLKWAARKNDTKKILLHSFAHLSDSKASLDFTKKVMDNAEERMTNSDYEVSQTPFGYFLDLDLQAPGEPLARLFKQIDVKL
ncbi:threonyl-tRNA synthetase editing domain-containing protein [bacterium]|nr:threonyl-tRNA synthetase editing domain-containing protein [bacterium]